MVFTVSGGYHVSNKPHSLTLGDGLPQKLPGTNIHLSVKQLYRVVQDNDPDRGPWRVSTAEYIYTLMRGGRRGTRPKRLLSYQWHPKPQANYNYPHLHPGPATEIRPEFQRAHIPTGRVALEDVIRFALSQLGAQAQRDDWKEVLAGTQGRFEGYQSWSGSGPTGPIRPTS